VSNVIDLKQHFNGDSEGLTLDVEEDEDVDGLITRWHLISGDFPDEVKLAWKGKQLQRGRTWKTEGVSSGDTVTICRGWKSKDWAALA
jgi:hypothetical protein